MHLPDLREMLMVALLSSIYAKRALNEPDANNKSDRYIVTLKSEVDLHEHIRFVQDLSKTSKIDDNHTFLGISHNYTFGDFKAYAGQLDVSVVTQLKNHGDVLAVEQDRVWNPFETTDLIKQSSPPYALHLISHRGTNDKGTYYYDSSAGQGTYGYVVDSGIFTSHTDFEGRAMLGYNAIKNVPFEDVDGHGTHVASTMCGSKFGVAKKCNLVAVKIINKGLTIPSYMLDGYVWAVNDIIAKKRQANAVINVSLGGPFSLSLNRAVDHAYSQGITTIASAGNQDQDAHKESPGSAAGAITVASTDAQRRRARKSNWGRDVDIFAPGDRIVGAAATSDKGTAVRSGTSQAAPHVAGLVLYFKAMSHLPDAKATREHLLKVATPGVVQDPMRAANRFAYNGCGR
ncbi:subtilisin-like protein [Myriangium duriaei CBS 260.36]|uniref:Subtilisin-like protein n=1 Tax=Myriangium duriaei CBS 260.36 TaxID=1168546 RepID=A0A9P4MDS4_9PEZI|nr:subtilisin-like protein [Myriangium duriaei CBS 260.36]